MRNGSPTARPRATPICTCAPTVPSSAPSRGASTRPACARRRSRSCRPRRATRSHANLVTPAQGPARLGQPAAGRADEHRRRSSPRTPRSLTSAAQDEERNWIAITAASVMLAIALLWLTNRWITRPLRAPGRPGRARWPDSGCPAAVQEILETPVNETVVQPEVEPVRVHAGGEVHEVEVALNKVQDSAISLAVEQATLRRSIADAYVNLGRRNQNLLSRQLEFITPARERRVRPRHPRAPLPPRPPRARACAATPSRCSCSRASRRPARGARRWRWATSCAARSARSRATGGCACVTSTTRASTARPRPT